MRYVEIESHKAIQLAGYIIASATHQPFQHTATILPVYDEAGNVIGKKRYEALISKGYVVSDANPRVKVTITRIPISDEEYEKLCLYHEKKVGTRYPVVAHLGLEYLLPPLRHQRRSLYCSQAAINGLAAAGLCTPNLVSRPHPGIAFVIAEILACERRKNIVCKK